MTAQRYVREVGKLLKCSSSKKKEVKAQLLAQINEKTDKGEPLDKVLGELGIPWDYANLYNDRFDRAERKKAKREKNIRRALIAAAIIAVIIVIARINLPSWSAIEDGGIFDAAQVEDEALRIIALFNSGDYDGLVESMNDEMQETLNAAKLSYAKAQFNGNFGAFKGIEEKAFSQAEQRGEKYAVAQIKASYENVTVSYTITFDADMKLAGIYFR